MSEKTVTFITLGVLGVIVLSGGGGVFFVKSSIGKKKGELSKLSAAITVAKNKSAKVAKTLPNPDHPDDPKKNISGLELEKRKVEAEETSKAGRIPFFRGKMRSGEPEIDVEYDVFFNQIEALRHKTGVAITSGRWLVPKKLTGAAAAKAPKLPANLHKATFELVCWGLFKDLVQFVGLLERSARQATVDTFVISAGRGPVPGIHSLKVSLSTFAYKATAPVAGEEKGEKPPTSTPVRSTEFP